MQEVTKEKKIPKKRASVSITNFFTNLNEKPEPKNIRKQKKKKTILRLGRNNNTLKMT